MMTTIRVNMKQFRDKWQWHTDSCWAGDMIAKSNGCVVTLTPAAYTAWLLEFNIFYTATED